MTGANRQVESSEQGQPGQALQGGSRDEAAATPRPYGNKAIEALPALRLAFARGTGRNRP